MIAIAGVAIFAALVAVWVLWGRPLLRRQPWAQPFFAWIEPYEIALWRKSETILWARFLQLLGIISTILGFLGAIDWTVITPLVPEEWRPFMPLVPMVLSIIGRIEESLRKDTSRPLAVVELPKDVPPAVAKAVERAEVAKDKAVAVIEADTVKAAAAEKAAEK